MTTLEELEAIVRAAWGADTCDPSDLDDWSPDNPSRGQCGVTALVVQDTLGGEKVGHHSGTGCRTAARSI